jgi:hypothetical protein
MNKEIARMALQFMQRAQLSGAEVPAFITVMNALNEIAEPKLMAPEPRATQGKTQ